MTQSECPLCRDHGKTELHTDHAPGSAPTDPPYSTSLLACGWTKTETPCPVLPIEARHAITSCGHPVDLYGCGDTDRHDLPPAGPQPSGWCPRCGTLAEVVVSEPRRLTEEDRPTREECEALDARGSGWPIARYVDGVFVDFAGRLIDPAEVRP